MKRKRQPGDIKAETKIAKQAPSNVLTPEEMSKIGPKLPPFIFEKFSEKYRQNFRYYWEELKQKFTEDDDECWVVVRECKLFKKVTDDNMKDIKWSDITKHDYYVQIGMLLFQKLIV
jgi:hypothetical protein